MLTLIKTEPAKVATLRPRPKAHGEDLDDTTPAHAASQVVDITLLLRRRRLTAPDLEPQGGDAA